MDPEFSGSDLDFRPIWIRGQEKKFDPDQEKHPDPTSCFLDQPSGIVKLTASL